MALVITSKDVYFTMQHAKEPDISGGICVEIIGHWVLVGWLSPIGLDFVACFL